MACSNSDGVTIIYSNTFQRNIQTLFFLCVVCDIITITSARGTITIKRIHLCLSLFLYIKKLNSYTFHTIVM